MPYDTFGYAWIDEHSEMHGPGELPQTAGSGEPFVPFTLLWYEQLLSVEEECLWLQN